MSRLVIAREELDSVFGNNSSANFPAIFRFINGFSDVFFLIFLTFDDHNKNRSSTFILTVGMIIGIIFRLLAALNYTEKGPSTIILSVINVIFGASFKVRRGTSVRRRRLQHFPLSRQVSDQLNAHQIGDSFQVIFCFFAATIVSFSTDATSGPNFYFYLVKFCIVAATLLFDVIFQEMNTISLITILPSALAYGALPVLFNISRFYQGIEGREQYEAKKSMMISSVKFYFLCLFVFMRMAFFARKAMVQKCRSRQILSGGWLILLLLAYIFWDVFDLAIRMIPEFNVGNNMEYLASIMIGFFCFVMFACPWRSYLFINQWIREEIPPLVTQYHFDVEEDTAEQYSPPPVATPIRRSNGKLNRNPVSSITHYSVSNSMFDGFISGSNNEIVFDATL